MSPFWKNVEFIMDSKGISFKELAFATGIPYSTITNGKNRKESLPSVDKGLKISKFLQVPLEQLLGEAATTLQNAPIGEQKSAAQKIQLCEKYINLIEAMEQMSDENRLAIIKMTESLKF
ncbi:MAG: helix-turn-helix transcriptional regulator [Treponema sp.]|nr:helix-turn-helix transcriptional regulator [Treponema sp.]